MAKSTSLAELHPPRAAHSEAKPRRRIAGTLSRRVEGLSKEISTLPVKPLLIGAGLGVALLGVALTVSSKRRSSPLGGLNPVLTKAALVALSRVISGQNVSRVATSALLDVAESLKS